MPAYFVVELEVTNPAGMEPFRAVPATLAQYGGRYLTPGWCHSTYRRRTGAKTDRHPRIHGHRGGETLVQFAGMPEDIADPARQLDRPRLDSRSRELTRRRLRPAVMMRLTGLSRRSS